MSVNHRVLRMYVVILYSGPVFLQGPSDAGVSKFWLCTVHLKLFAAMTTAVIRFYPSAIPFNIKKFC